VDNGISPTLLPPNQAFQAVNVNFRGDFAETRRPGFNHLISDIPPTWTGIFQGSMHYDGEAGQSGWLVARGGRFFFVTDEFVMRDVTPQLLIVTTSPFVTVGAGVQVSVDFNGNAPVHVGDTVIIGGFHFTVTIIQNNRLLLTQIDADVGTPVDPGASLLDNSGALISAFATYPASLNFVYMFQAENYGIVLGGQESTLIWDGKALRKSGANEVPSGFLGAYGWGRIWITRPDRRTFVAGDLVFGPSGTAAHGYRDAILKFTENDFLNEGGSFGIPYEAGPITAMQFLATQDTSLGIGVLLVGTTNMVFSVNAPVDRTTWKQLTYPIQTVSLIDYGPAGPRSTISVNGDMWYRSEDGVRSFIVARRYFPQPGNTPMSHEMPIFDDDTPFLLFYGSSVLFDNKLFITVSPYMRADQQVMHRGMATINFDLVSDLRQKQAPAWEGIKTGLQILQLNKCRISGNERFFIWAQGPTDVELWEGDWTDNGIADEYTVQVGGTQTVTRKPIACLLQTRAEDYGVPLELKRLIMGEIYVEDIADSVTFTISYKPDDYPNWVSWQTFTLCSTASQCAPTVTPPNCFFMPNARSYAARLTLPQPQDDCNGMTGKPMREFHDCQFQLEWSGHCRIRRFFTHIKVQTQPTEGSCPPAVTCIAFPACDDDLFTYDSHP
jgi:hypothetical protein